MLEMFVLALTHQEVRFCLQKRSVQPNTQTLTLLNEQFWSIVIVLKTSVNCRSLDRHNCDYSSIRLFRVSIIEYSTLVIIRATELLYQGSRRDEQK